MILNKLALALGLVAGAFVIATIVLSVFVANHGAALNECEKNLTGTPAITTQAPEQATTVPSETTEQPIKEDVSYRLPTDVIPTLYTLHLNPNLKTRLFNGTNRITLNVLSRTQHIVLHSVGLDIANVEFSTGDRSVPVTFELVRRQEFLRITLQESIAAGSNYVLTIDFGGDTRNRIVGLYSSSYVNAAGQTRYMATSKFEPTFARQAFPCFDEPALKAKFKTSLVRPLNDNYIALSNMNEDRTETDSASETAIVHFAESVPMSTYLACFIVSDFQFKQLPIDANGVGENFILRAFATPAQLEKVTFALETGKLVTEFFIDYFQEEYPLPKLDMAAIPDFVSGAMEHWGLVTYRETALLYDRDISSSANQQRVAEVVAHEIAHMWFGNLVTMAWWNELWLNEGFARYIQYKGVNAALPDWRILDQFAVQDLQSVMALDGTLASHPIVQTAESPDQITELFDSITYSKGASVIRMMEDFVGPQIFRTAVSNYLKAHKYKTAVTEDLLAELHKLDGSLNVKDVIATWTKQMGYPVVNVEHVSGNQYRLTQKRFLFNPDARSGESVFNYRWHIPITWKTDEKTDVQRNWFKNNDAQLIIDIGSHKWLKLNYDQVGYYRVNYSPTMWQSLTEALIANINSFSVVDRGHLLNDVFSLAEATQVNYATALQLTSYLKNEPDYVPWSVASSELNGLKNSLYYTEMFAKFSKFGKSIIEPRYDQISWVVGVNHQDNKLRRVILSLACSMGVQSCIDKAGTEFTSWLANTSNRPSPDLRDLIYNWGMFSVGNEARWFQMWDLYLRESDAQEKIKLASALSTVQVPWLLQRYVDLAWDENNVRGQDYFSVMANIASNRVGESIVWDYVRTHWPQLVKRFGLNERYLGRLIPNITRRFNTEIRLQEMHQFFAKYPEAGAGASARAQALTQVEDNIKWLENNVKDIGTWLDQN